MSAAARHCNYRHLTGSRRLFCFLLADASDPLFFFICSLKRSFCDCALCGCVYGRTLYWLAVWAMAAARCGAWLVSAAELAVLNGPLKGLGL